MSDRCGTYRISDIPKRKRAKVPPSWRGFVRFPGTVDMSAWYTMFVGPMYDEFVQSIKVVGVSANRRKIMIGDYDVLDPPKVWVAL